MNLIKMALRSLVAAVGMMGLVALLCYAYGVGETKLSLTSLIGTTGLCSFMFCIFVLADIEASKFKDPRPLVIREWEAARQQRHKCPYCNK